MNANYKTLICLNGELPDDHFFSRHQHLFVVAVDGAANQLCDRGIMYDLITGDLDSVRPELLSGDVEIIHLPSQDASDFQKTTEYLRKEKLLPAIVVGISGGHLDHILHNVNWFTQLDCIFLSNSMMGFMLKDREVKKLQLKLGSKISLIGIPNAIVTTSGLKWNLNQHVLSFPGANSCFNRTLNEEIQIEISSGQVLVLVYQEEVMDAGLKSVTPKHGLY